MMLKNQHHQLALGPVGHQPVILAKSPMFKRAFQPVEGMLKNSSPLDASPSLWENPPVCWAQPPIWPVVSPSCPAQYGHWRPQYPELPAGKTPAPPDEKSGGRPKIRACPNHKSLVIQRKRDDIWLFWPIKQTTISEINGSPLNLNPTPRTYPRFSAGFSASRSAKRTGLVRDHFALVTEATVLGLWWRKCNNNQESTTKLRFLLQHNG